MALSLISVHRGSGTSVSSGDALSPAATLRSGAGGKDCSIGLKPLRLSLQVNGSNALCGAISRRPLIPVASFRFEAPLCRPRLPSQEYRKTVRRNADQMTLWEGEALSSRARISSAGASLSRVLIQLATRTSARCLCELHLIGLPSDRLSRL